jgi:tetratricopeptide (TPR) repeat protein
VCAWEGAVQINNEGVRALNKKQWTAAIDKLMSAVLLEPKYSRGRENLAIAHNEYGLYLRSKNEHESFRQFHLAFYVQHGPTIEKNLTGMTKYMGWEPDRYEDHVKLGDLYRAEGDLVSALVEYRAASRFKKDRVLFTKLGAIQRLFEEGTEGESPELQALLSHHPAANAVHNSLVVQDLLFIAENLESQGKWKSAAETLSRCVKEKAELEIGWLGLANCYIKSKDFDRAEKTLLEAKKRFADAPGKLMSVSKVLMENQAESGNLEGLQESRRAFLAKFPYSAEAKIMREELDYFDLDYSRIKRFQSGLQPLFLALPVLPLKVYVGPAKGMASGNKIYTTSVLLRYTMLARRALSEWASATDNKLKYIMVEKPLDADICCEWTTDLARRKHSFTAGETTSIKQPTNGKVSSSALVFLLDPKKILSDRSFYSVCLHELGHALGLEHSLQPEDVMYWGGTELTGTGELTKLAKGDVCQIRKFYSDPFQARDVALQFARAAYASKDYEKAFELLTPHERENLLPSQFQLRMEHEMVDPPPASFEVLNARIFPSRAEFGLIGTNGANKSYYFVRVVHSADGSFQIEQPRRVH